MKQASIHDPAKWDRRFLRLAREVALWSKDPSTKVGAVIVDPNTRRVLGLGYNGLPAGVNDTHDRLNDRALKYAMTVHAELNAILNAVASVRGATLYTWPLPPCSNCMAAAIQSGILKVVSIHPSDEHLDRWKSSLLLARNMCLDANVRYHHYHQEFLDA